MIVIDESHRLAAQQVEREAFDWVTPARMGQIADHLSDLLGDGVFLRLGRTFREAWIAARLASKRNAQMVRLLKESDGPTPDFEIRNADLTLRFEAVEADIPGRRRQDEYRKSGSASVERMLFTNLETMTQHMRALTARKAAKAYGQCFGLVVHLNPPAFSFDPALRWQGLVDGTAPAARAFDEIWVLRDQGVLVWRNGEPLQESSIDSF